MTLDASTVSHQNIPRSLKTKSLPQTTKPQPANKFYDKIFTQALDNYQAYEKHQQKLQQFQKEIKKIKDSRYLCIPLASQNSTDDEQQQKIPSMLVNQTLINDMKYKKQRMQTKMFQQNERANEILKQNQQLITKLFSIQTGIDYYKGPISSNKGMNSTSRTNFASIPNTTQNSPIGSLNAGFQRQRLEKIDNENLRIMKKIMNASSNLNKKRFEDDYSRHEKYKSNIQKSKGMEIENIVKLQKKHFAHVESKTSHHVLPLLNPYQRRSQSMIDNSLTVPQSVTNSIQVHKKEKPSFLGENPTPSIQEESQNLVTSSLVESELKTFELKESINRVIAMNRTEVDKKSGNKFLSTKLPKSNKRNKVNKSFNKNSEYTWQSELQANEQDDKDQSQPQINSNAFKLSLQQQLVSQRVKKNIIKDKRSFLKLLAADDKASKNTKQPKMQIKGPFKMANKFSTYKLVKQFHNTSIESQEEKHIYLQIGNQEELMKNGESLINGKVSLLEDKSIELFKQLTQNGSSTGRLVENDNEMHENSNILIGNEEIQILQRNEQIDGQSIGEQLQSVKQSIDEDAQNDEEVQEECRQSQTSIDGETKNHFEEQF